MLRQKEGKRSLLAESKNGKLEMEDSGSAEQFHWHRVCFSSLFPVVPTVAHATKCNRSITSSLEVICPDYIIKQISCLIEANSRSKSVAPWI